VCSPSAGRACRPGDHVVPTLARVQILWWLAPPVVATVLAMVWVAWLGRSGRGEVDREVAVRRMSEALSRPAKPTRPGPGTRPRTAQPGERSTGVAVRVSRRTTDESHGRTRRAS
jgi:hypothetical protein